MTRIPEMITCEECQNPDGSYVTVFGTHETCSYCMGSGRTPNPIIDMRYLRDRIAAHGIAADLYMSGGNCATIGIGGIIPDTDDPHTFGGDYAYLVGVGSYHNGIAHREELGAGSDEYFHVATPNAPDGTPQFPYDPYAIVMGDEETVEAFATRIATAYAQLRTAHPVTA